jgi:uncharacterized protein (TIGR03066 family)
MRSAYLTGVLGLFVLALSLSAAPAPEKKEDKPKDLILGKWSREDPKTKETVVIEFTKDGKVLIKATAEGKKLEFGGVYTFATEDKIDVEINFGEGQKKKETLTVKVTKDELTTTDARDKKETFNRVK